MLSAGLGVAIDEVVRDQLAAVGLNPDRVAGDPVELDRPGEVDADAVGFDQVGVVEVAADQAAGSGHSHGVAVDVLALHRGGGQLHAGRVGINLIGQGRAHEAEAACGIADAAGHAGDVVVGSGCR